ncbi:MAG: EAL domain-containing protein [Candidatus Thiodiazotropha endolucinida]
MFLCLKVIVSIVSFIMPYIVEAEARLSANSPANSSKIPLTAAEEEWLAENPVIRVALDPGWAPVEFRNDDGHYQGISIDYLNRIEDLLNIQFSIVKGLSWQEAFHAVKNRQADMFASVSRTPLREKYFLFTDSYISMPIHIFARDDISYVGNLDNLDGKRIAVVQNYAIHDWISNDYPELTLIPVKSPKEGLTHVSRGDADVFIGNIVTANYYLGKYRLTNVRVAGDTPYANNQSMAVRDDWPIFQRILDKALTSISKDAHSRIYSRWMSVRFKHVFDIYEHWKESTIILSLLFFLFIWNRSLSFMVNRKTALYRKELVLRKENEAQFKALSETGFEAILISENGVCINVNSSALEIFGYTFEEVVGRRTIEWFAEEYHDSFKVNAFSGSEEPHKVLAKRKDGSVFESLIRSKSINLMERLVQVTALLDLSELRRAEKALLESSQRYKSVLETTKDGFWVTNNQGVLIEVNEAYCRLSGYNKKDLIGMPVSELDAFDSDEDVAYRLKSVIQQGNDLHESYHRRKDGAIWPVEVSISYASVQGGEFFVFIRDIHDRKRSEIISDLRQQLSELVYLGNREKLLRTALDAAEALTGSEIGFFHFIEEDQETISMQTWSTRTFLEKCFAEDNGLHYPVSEAGVWVDCIRQRRPVIFNNYDLLPHKKGLPDGHVLLHRILTVPLLRDEKIVGVIGVGNKAVNYNAQDILIVSQVADMAYDFVEREQNEKKIEFMAYHDILTGLPNRELLSDRLRQSIALTRRSGKLLAVCYLDMDGFKPVNDRHGHKVGDDLLIDIAARLQDELRMDDTLARLGGDEFVILLNNLVTIDECELVIQRILEKINQPYVIDDHRIHVSASIGVTVFPFDDQDSDALIRHADQAMYVAKAAGKNIYSLYKHIQNKKADSRRQKLSDFELALKNRQLVLHFQPRIQLGTGEAVGVEALVRWQHPEQGLLQPGHFLPAIEGMPQEIVLDEWVIRTALDQHMAWREQGLLLPVSVNISPRIVHQQSFVEFLESLLSEYPSDVASNLEMEVLETSAIGDTTKVTTVMNACSRMGVNFSLDDFGTGYSSLTYFHHLPINILKIDRIFVSQMLVDARDMDIVEGVLQMADTLGRPVVAEGVESAELGLMLWQLGCRYAQGFAIAKPMPSEDVAEWINVWESDNFSHDFQSAAKEFTNLYDVNVSIYSIRLWLKRFAEYLYGRLNIDCLELDEEQSQFGHWYKGIGHFRYGKKSNYSNIRPKHNQLHKLAQEIITASEGESKEQAISRLSELNQVGNELIFMLRQLAKQ